MTDKEKIVYDILCSEEQPPEGQHWEGFVASKIAAALAQPEPEPVAIWELQEGGWDTIADADWMETLPIGTKLYTARPQHESTCAQCEKKASDGWALYCVDCLREFYKHDPTTKREWVELTDEEMCDIRGRVQEYTPIDAIEYGKVLQFFTAEALEDKNR